MRWALLALALVGCREILGIEDLEQGGGTPDAPALTDGRPSDGLAGAADAPGSLDAPVCSNPFVAVNGIRCYYLAGAAGRAAAQSGCAAMGAHLVYVADVAEENDLTTWLTGQGTGAAWIGLTETGSNFVWDDGSAPATTFWQADEPSGDAADTCVIVDLTAPFGWDAVACSLSHASVCERP